MLGLNSSKSMSSFKNLVAALGFVCFSSLALLPVSMTVCGPVTSRILHHAKKVHHIIDSSPSAQLAIARPYSAAVERDVIPTEGDPARNLFEHTGLARAPAGNEHSGAQVHPAEGFVRAAKV